MLRISLLFALCLCQTAILSAKFYDDCAKHLTISTADAKQQLPSLRIDLNHTTDRNVAAYCIFADCNPSAMNASASHHVSQYYECLAQTGREGDIDETYLLVRFRHAVGFANQITTFVHGAMVAKLLNMTMLLPYVMGETVQAHSPKGQPYLTGSYPVSFDTYFDEFYFMERMAQLGIRVRKQYPDAVKGWSYREDYAFVPPLSSQHTILDNVMRTAQNEKIVQELVPNNNNNNNRQSAARSVRGVTLASPWDIQWDVSLMPMFDELHAAIRIEPIAQARANDIVKKMGGRGKFLALHLRVEDDHNYHYWELNVTQKKFIENEIGGAIEALLREKIPNMENIFVISGVDCETDPMMQPLKAL